MINHRSLTARVVTMALLAGVVMAGVVTSLVLKVRAELFSVREEFPRVAVDAAASQVAYFERQEETGAMSRADAQKAALDVVRRLRFDGENYVWVNDLTPRMVMHPMKPELDGKDLSGFKDPAGKALFIEMVNGVKASSRGEARVDYLWPKPGAAEPVPKLSYVKRSARWSWVLGAGVYMDDVREKVNALILWSAGVTSLTLLVMLVLAVWVARRISEPLVAAIHSLDSGSTQVAQASGTVAGISETLAHDATSSASAVQQSNAAVGNVSERTRSNANDARQMQALMEAAAGHVEETARALESIVQHMTKVRDGNGRVRQVVKTIDELAFQTNLLALNAAVEASRAGQAGAGFAVVAQEVRALAQRSAEAARSTGGMIDDTVSGIADGTSLIMGCAKEFATLREQVTSLGALVASIAKASNEQAGNLGEVGQGLSSLDASTQRTASSAEQIASAATQLNSQAEVLRDVVHTINVLVLGTAEA